VAACLRLMLMQAACVSCCPAPCSDITSWQWTGMRMFDKSRAFRASGSLTSRASSTLWRRACARSAFCTCTGTWCRTWSSSPFATKRRRERSATGFDPSSVLPGPPYSMPAAAPTPSTWCALELCKVLPLRFSGGCPCQPFPSVSLAPLKEFICSVLWRPVQVVSLPCVFGSKPLWLPCTTHQRVSCLKAARHASACLVSRQQVLPFACCNPITVLVLYKCCLGLPQE